MDMMMINISVAKARLSEVLKLVEAGETVLLARRNRPVAELRPVRQATSARRPFGLCAGEFVVPDDFDAPLPGDILDGFEGR